MKCVSHKIFTILILLLLLVTKGGTDDDYEDYYDDYDTEVVAIVSGVIGGFCILVPLAIFCWCHKFAKRPGRVVNPTAVPTVTQTQYGGTYGNNFSHNIPTQFGTQFTYGQHQQSQPNPYQKQSQPDQNAQPPPFTYQY